jgi:hypothetical protein
MEPGGESSAGVWGDRSHRLRRAAMTDRLGGAALDGHRRFETGQPVMTPYTRIPTGFGIKFLGGVFLIVGTADMIIIGLYPEYALKIFGTTLTGTAGYLVKLQSPVVHFLIGYGFLFLRPWAWGLGLAYAGFGMISELMNQQVWGFHPVRSAFIATTGLFVAYLIWRREVFGSANAWPDARRPAPKESS